MHMETLQRKSNFALKTGRRLILTGYVFCIIIQILVYLNVFTSVYERLAEMLGSVQQGMFLFNFLFFHVPSLLFIVPGFLVLKGHPNPLFKFSVKLLLFAIVFQILMNGFVYDFSTNFFFGYFGLSGVYFIYVLLFVLITNFPSIYGYSYLTSCTGIDYSRIVLLCICVLITSLLSIVNQIITGTNQVGDFSPVAPKIAGLGTTVAFVLINVITYM